MAKISIDLDEPIAPDPQVKQVDKLTTKLPSVSKAKATALKDSPRVQFSFTNVPKPIKDAFAVEAGRRGLTLKEYLYFCLRAGGLDVPEADRIDGRRR